MLQQLPIAFFTKLYLPMLWNTFFSNVSVTAEYTGGNKQIVADDEGVVQKNDRSTPASECNVQLFECGTQVHK